MTADWDFAQLSKIASAHGGPQEYLDLVKGAAKAEGRAQGALAAVTVSTAWAVGSRTYRRMQIRKRLADEAERELLRGMRDPASPPESDDEDDDDETCDPEGP